MNIIQKNIDFCNNNNLDTDMNVFKLYSKISKKCFYFEENDDEDNENTKKRNFSKFLNQNYSHLENNGLKKIFFYSKILQNMETKFNNNNMYYHDWNISYWNFFFTKYTYRRGIFNNRKYDWNFFKL